jgi:hypothetical protein
MAYSVDQSIFLMVVVHGEVQLLCCEQFMLCKGVVGSLLVCNDNASVLVRWRTITQSCITAILRVSRLCTGMQTGDRFTSTQIANKICI